MARNTTRLKSTGGKKKTPKKRAVREVPVNCADLKVAGPRMVEIEIEISESAEAALREIAALSNQSLDTVVSVLLAAEVIRVKAI